MKNLIYNNFGEWYEGLYKDVNNPCSAARSFEMKHAEKTKECWLLVHGYRGYPGELVSPAEVLYDEGYDVFVPRLPGHGTCGRDFIKTGEADWVGMIDNAYRQLAREYEKVNILGHSMGSAVSAIVMKKKEGNGKLVLASPSFENLQMNLGARIILRVLSPFTPKIRCGWHINPHYHLHYENAPCDEEYLGREYFCWYFTRQLFDYRRISKKGLAAVKKCKNDLLIIYPGHDLVISEPSVKLYLSQGGDARNIEKIEAGSHCIFYDKSETAEHQALMALRGFAAK